VFAAQVARRLGEGARPHGGVTADLEPAAWQLLARCLAAEPTARPTAADLVAELTALITHLDWERAPTIGWPVSFLL
jgi:hypothetical protein